MMRSILLAATLALGLAACDEAGQSDTMRLTGTSWIAETINGKPVIEPGGVTLTFSDERVTGRSGCNTYFGAAEHENGALKVGSIGATKMACLRDGLMQQESEYLNTLQAAQNYAVQSDRLTLTAPAGGVLVFTATSGPPPAAS
jgi:heat shock protein HslJ